MIINSTKKISVNGVMLISVNNASLPFEVLIDMIFAFIVLVRVTHPTLLFQCDV